MSMNVVVLQGNLTADPVLRHGQSGTAVVNFSIAVNEKYQDKEETSFIDCVAFGKQGEIIEKFFHKGKEILINGRFRQSRWKNDEGQTRSKIEVVLNNIGGFSFTSGTPRGESEEQPAAAAAAEEGEELF